MGVVTMYYAEKVINGVLHWRSTPNGLWQPRTLEQLTTELLRARQQLTDSLDVSDSRSSRYHGKV